MWTLVVMQSVLCGDGFLGTGMDDKSAVTEAIDEIAYVDAVLGVELEGYKVSVRGWNCGF